MCSILTKEWLCEEDYEEYSYKQTNDYNQRLYE